MVYLMRNLTVLILSVLLMSCGGSLISQSERDAIAELACAELRVANYDESLKRLRIVNTARESLGEEVFLGEDKEIRRYLRWETCDQFILQDEGYLSETNRREKAYGLLKRNAESEGDKVHSEYFTGDSYLIMAGELRTAELIDTQTMSVYSGDVNGIRRTDRNGQGIVRYTTSRSYVNGQTEGLAQDWHMNGQLALVRTYVGGRAEGLDQQWYENGQLEFECTRVDGECDGVARLWRESGQQWVVAEVVNGKKHGRVREWDEKGVLMSDVMYDDDIMQSQ